MNPWKPWFIFRPTQIVRRLTFHPTSTYRRLPVAWGGQLLALDDEHIGRCLGTTGIYDLAVSELLFRLIQPGDLVVDAGANIGYMSVLAATAGAHVLAYEPNPQLLPVLQQNLGMRGEVRPVALAAAPRHSSPRIRPLTTTAWDAWGLLPMPARFRCRWKPSMPNWPAARCRS